MPGLGDLVTNFTSNTSGFDRGVKSSKAGIKSFEAVTKASMAAVKASFIAATGGIIAVAGAIYGLQSNINSLDAVAKQSAKTGLSGKFLQQLEFAADQSGVSAETLTASIKKMTLFMGQAQNGSKAAESSLAALGLTAADLGRLAPEDQFKTIAEAISKLPTAAQRAAAAVSIFGKSGMDMTTLFGGGLKGINELMEKAQSLGIGVNAEGLKKIEAANDAIGQMKAAMGALVDQVTVSLAPTFEDIADSITQWIPPVTEFVAKFAEMEGKWEWLAETSSAAFDVAFEAITLAWNDMWDGFPERAATALKETLALLDPLKSIAKTNQKNQEGFDAELAKMRGIAPQAQPIVADPGQGLAMAKQRLQSQMAKLTSMQGLKDTPFVGPKAENAGAKGSGDFAGLGAVISKTLGPIAGGIKGGVMAKVDDLKKNAEFFGKLGKAAFTGDGEKPKEFAPKFAGAMTKGSAGAYSTIVQAMTQRADPAVKATEKQTKELVKAIVSKPPAIFNLVAAFTP